MNNLSMSKENPGVLKESVKLSTEEEMAAQEVALLNYIEDLAIKFQLACEIGLAKRND